MGGFDYENMRKWWLWFIKLPRERRVVLTIIIIMALGVYIYFHYGRFQALKVENREMKRDLQKAMEEVASLRSRNAELHRENLHYKELLDPIRQKAEQLYPGLETDAALAKLAKDVNTVRKLATRDVYRPLSSELREHIVTDLRAFRSGYSK